jgi:N6-L-threonylcarbamoyladenine synthase
MKILGLETSCDETAAAVVEIDDSLACTLLTNVVASSMDLHVQYGGVVPEIAARSHIESVIPVVDEAVSPVGWDAIDAIAVTYGAGLGGSLLVGVMTARSLAIAKDKPLYGINHVEGHVYANFITATNLPGLVLPASAPVFPCLALIVSGGHSQLAIFRDHFDYSLLGQTQDDAVGEAFDKVAKIIGLPYPGGPSVGKKALEGNAHAFELPKAKMPHKYDFSFSGLKTAVLRKAQELIGEDFTFPSKDLPGRLSETQKADIAAVFQRVAIETVVDKTILAYEEHAPASVVIAGGVAASPELRHQLKERLPIEVRYQDPKLCTDNGAMIAALGAFKAKLDQPAADPYALQPEPNLSM